MDPYTLNPIEPFHGTLLKEPSMEPLMDPYLGTWILWDGDARHDSLFQAVAKETCAVADYIYG